MMDSAASIDSSSSLPPIRFINFNHFKVLGTFPRFPENRNIARDIESIGRWKREKALIVFISHCWLRGWRGAEGWDGRAHPDNANGGKYALCVEGIEKLWRAVAPRMEECYIWCDYGCIDQNGDPAGELKQLDKIVEICDCIFTPIYDKDHDKWELEFTTDGLFEDYKSPAWNGNDFSYLNRGWCRVEMFYASNIPLIEDSEERRGRLKAGLLYHRMQGRRPHFLYGSLEKATSLTPYCLPPLQNSYFERYNPEKGTLTKITDREKITKLVNELRPLMKNVTEGYEGEMKDGKMHGQGKYVYASGSVYEGEWKDDKKLGRGKCVYADGEVYEGEWKDGKKHGRGKYVYADGEVYEGEYKDGKMLGQGKYVYASGEVYEGEWKDDKKHGQGKLVYADGSVYEGEWKDDKMHGQGKLVYADGSVYKGEWKDDKMHGQGKLVYASGSVYEGEWKDDKKHGQGKYVYASGEVYEGEWKDDKMHGQGKYVYASGEVYEGEWKDDKKHGERTCVLC